MSYLNQTLILIGLIYFSIVVLIGMKMGDKERALEKYEKDEDQPATYDPIASDLPSEVDIEIQIEPATRTINTSAIMNGIPFENYRYAFFLYINGIKFGVRPYEYEPNAQFEYPANTHEISITLYMADRNKKITTKEKSLILAEALSPDKEPHR